MWSIKKWLELRSPHQASYQDDNDIPLYFLHIPKTAGMSMRQIIRKRYGDGLCPAVMWDDFFREPEWRSARYHAYHGHFGIELPRFLGIRMRTFTLLRDPV